jgi:phosphate uptake regulator
MPVTARLSRRFYERFGDELTNELVNWFNSVDATYRSDLRDLNEVNFARFDAKLEQRVSALDARIDGLEARMDKRFEVLDAKVDTRIAELRESVTARIAASESRLMRWMFTLWTGTMLAQAGLILAVLRLK